MKKFIAFLILAVFVVIMVNMLTGCNVNQRQIRKLDGLVLQQPAEFARLSNLINPCFTGKAKSDTVMKHDSISLPPVTNTVTVTRNDTVYTTKTVTQTKFIHDKMTIHDTIADNRAVTSIQGQVKGKSDSLVVVKTLLASQTQTTSNWRKWCLILAGVIGVSILAYVLKFFIKI